MNGFCVICGCGIAGHHDIEFIEEGKVHEGCLEEPPNPPVGR